jgi:uncharacterized membrane protein
MTCSYCAAEMPDISEFCPGCGRPVGAPEVLQAADSRDALLAALAYLTVAPAIVFLSVPAVNRSRFVRFHSWQSIFFASAAAITALVMKLLFGVFAVLPAIGLLLAWLCVGVTFIGTVVLWVLLTVKAAQGQSYELPVIGSMAAQLADKDVPR